MFLVILFLGLLIYLAVSDLKERPKMEAKEAWRNTFRYKGMLYIYDEDSRAATLWYEWIGPSGRFTRENTRVVVPLIKLPEEVRDLIMRTKYSKEEGS